MFREQVLTALRQARAVRRRHLHLLYTPALHDPVPEAADARREAATIVAPSHIAAAASANSGPPRLITLDTRRVAPYLLEQDAALDDPLLEASINQAHAEAVLGACADARLNLADADAESTACTVGGWIASEESAEQLARRIARFSLGWVNPGPQQQWVRWTQPHVLCSLWPLLGTEQRAELLGPATWLTCDTFGNVRTFDPETGAASEQVRAVEARPAQLDAATTAVLRNLPLVQELMPAWRRCAHDLQWNLPADADQRLHFHLQEAQRLELPASEVPVYALTAAPLLAQATRSPEWQAMLARLHERGPPLLQHLPPSFSQQWMPSPRQHPPAANETGSPP